MSFTRRSILTSLVAGIISGGQVGLAAAADISVCPSGCNYSAIQDGINAAVVGDRVVVGTPGRTTAEVYTGSVSMKSGITLISEGDDVHAIYSDPFKKAFLAYRETEVLKRTTLTVIQGDNASLPAVLFPMTMMGGEPAILDGFIVENTPNLGNVDVGLIMIQGNEPTIRNNIVRRNEGTGVSGGIHMGNALTTDTIRPLIENNVIHYVNGPGVGIMTGGYPTIRGNKIFTTPPDVTLDYTAPGVGLRDKASAIVENNLLFQNKRAGVGSGSGVQALAGHGIYDSGNELIIRGNTIHSQSFGAGVMIAGQADQPTENVIITVENNLIWGNRAGIRTATEGFNQYLGQLTIRGNSFDSFGGVNRSPHEADVMAYSIRTLIIDDNDMIGGYTDNNGVRHQAGGIGVLTQYIDDMAITNNTITDKLRAGIRTQGSGLGMGSGDYHFNISNNDIINSGWGGMSIVGNVQTLFEPSSLPWGTIEGNRISENGIGGINIQGPMVVDILNNEIHHNRAGGIHSGGERELFVTGTGGASIPYFFQWGKGQLEVNVRGNKVHNNGRDGFGGGIDLRHASGTIENNLVYKNHMGGIRFGDAIDSITNNTLAYNGLSGLGAGIVYDDLAGAVNDLPHGSPPAAFPIRNNIVVGHPVAGINAGTVSFTFDEASQEWVMEFTGTCGDWVGLREYNLYSLNNGTGESCNDNTFPFCQLPQSASCSFNTGELNTDPKFVDAANDNYQLQATSAAVGGGLGGVDMGAFGGPNAINW